MANFSEETILQTLIELIKIPSVTGHHAEIQKAYTFIESLFSKDMFSVFYEEKEGVISQIITFRGVNYKKAKYILSGHIDVIAADEADFLPRVEGEKLFGRGSADMKAGIVAFIFSLLRIAQEGKHYDCALVITPDEEVGGRNGVGYLVNEIGLDPEFVLVGDGPRYDCLTITTKEKGVAWIELFADGVAAHAARPWLGDNALNKLLFAIESVRTLVGKEDVDDWHSTATLSHVNTKNHSYNRVPENARAVIDIRFTEELADTPEALFSKIQRVLPLGVSAQLLVGGAILFTDESHPIIQKLQTIMQKVHHQTIPFGFGHGASDGRYFSAKNIPVVLIGPIGGAWHAPNEWVHIQSVFALVESTTAFLKETVQGRIFS
jgi:succinyl-diaminopimelate desuccinylase